MVEAFNRTFGTDENSMEAWERMCVLVGMERIPETLKARRNVRILSSLPASLFSFATFPEAHVLKCC